MRKSLPCVKGKQSAVAVVNDSPVDCQSSDRSVRSRLSAEQADGGIDRSQSKSCVDVFGQTKQSFR